MWYCRTCKTEIKWDTAVRCHNCLTPKGERTVNREHANAKTDISKWYQGKKLGCLIMIGIGFAFLVFVGLLSVDTRTPDQLYESAQDNYNEGYYYRATSDLNKIPELNEDQRKLLERCELAVKAAIKDMRAKEAKALAESRSSTTKKSNSSQWESILELWHPGTKIYYGLGENKKYWATVMDIGDIYVNGRKTKGVLLSFPDGSVEWKDRMYIKRNDHLYFTRKGNI